MAIKLSFHGAAGGVTGSCHLVKAGGLKILIDCGLFQGEGQWRNKNEGEFGFEPSEIDYLLLTHGHLDHCGRIPLLVKRGFRGKIISTAATYEIAKVVLLDSAHIQEEDFEHWRKINLRQGVKPKPPLYTTLEALESMNHFGPHIKYDDPLDLNQRVRVTYKDAGHILGAAFIVIEVKNELRLLFSGDLGNTNKPIIRDPDFIKNADVVVMETTYGDRLHREFNESVDQLLDIVADTFRRGGNVVIPSFAVERAQDLLYVLREAHENGRLPNCRVFLDSPMGISVTNIMRRHPECFDLATRKMLESHHDPFHFPGLQLSKTQVASRQINAIKNNAIIIAGAGMCNGGRIRLHLKHNLWRKECSIVFLGYQANGTLGREIVEGAKRVKFLGESYSVNAQVHTLGGFSSHADQNTLIAWLERNNKPQKVFLVHGESNATEAFAQTLRQRQSAQEVTVAEADKEYVI